MKTTVLIVCTLFLFNASFSQINELKKGQEARKKYIDRAGNKGVTSNKQLTDYVNPFIGTGGHGHTFPGATLPFGIQIYDQLLDVIFDFVERQNRRCKEKTRMVEKRVK